MALVVVLIIVFAALFGLAFIFAFYTRRNTFVSVTSLVTCHNKRITLIFVFFVILVVLRNDCGKTEKRKFLKRTSRVSSGKPPQALVETHSSNFTSKEDALILKPFVYFLIFTAKKYHNLPTFLQAKEVVVTSRTQPVRLSVPARRISTSS